MPTPLETLLTESLFFTHNNQRVFKYADPRITVEDDPYIADLIPAIIETLRTGKPS